MWDEAVRSWHDLDGRVVTGWAGTAWVLTGGDDGVPAVFERPDVPLAQYRGGMAERAEPALPIGGIEVLDLVESEGIVAEVLLAVGVSACCWRPSRPSASGAG